MINHFVRLLNSSNSLTFSNDTLKVCLPDKFMKIGIGKVGKKKLHQEYEHLVFLGSTKLSKFIPRYNLESNFFCNILNVESLLPTDRTFDAAKKIYDHFNALASYQTLSLEIIPYLKKEIHCAGMDFFLNQIEKKEMLIGPIHGDFHLNNIMKNQSGELKIIDLDLSMKNWIRQFDLINVLVSEYILTQGVKWKEAFLAAWKNQMALAALDESWPECSVEDKKIHFYLYFIKRTIDEHVEFTSEEHLKLLQVLGLS
ncbi:MAG: aminoglycoside phosphotransferase family protein [Bacteriovoracaceae bacterium]|nr:aminoglycoside phosphotransferase family protein [Bacteriovoracaceae bacterium]